MSPDTETLTWPAAWVRALLPTAILRVLSDEPLHGYGIAAALESRGLGRPKGGSLYPILAHLEEDGAVAAAWSEGESGPGRRVYTLTTAGARRLDQEQRRWAALMDTLR